jgi:cytochrome c-type biogenesis protein
MATFGLAFLAGILSVLSPCVMPLLPLVLGAAASEHRMGPAALAAGLAISFVAIGLFVATIGFSIGLDGDVFRRAAAVLLILVGVVLMVPVMQVRFATAAGPMSNWTEQRFGGFSTAGLTGQFFVGLLLGAVWSPCVGPTLGAASVLAAQGKDLGAVALTMALFGLGAALPMLLLGMLSREALMRWRDRMIDLGKGAKAALGVVLVLVGIAILTGFDKALETELVAIAPSWLTAVTTRF